MMFLAFLKAIILLVLLGNILALHQHCDDKLNICLYTNGTMYVDTLEGARNKCALNSSILLEIYDEEYQNVVDQAFRKWGVFNGNNLWLNLKKYGPTFRWISTGIEVTYTKWSQNAEGAPYACIFFSNNSSGWQPYWTDSFDHAFICLQNSSQPSSPSIEKTTGTPQKQPQPTTVNFQRKEGNNEDTTSKKVLTGCLVAIFLLILLAAILLSIWCFSRRKKKLNSGTTDVQIGQIPPPYDSSTQKSQKSIFYINKNSNNTLTATGKSISNLYTRPDDNLSHIIRYHKPPDLREDPSIYETIKTFDINQFNDPDANNQIVNYSWDDDVYAEEFNA